MLISPPTILVVGTRANSLQQTVIMLVVVVAMVAVGCSRSGEEEALNNAQESTTTSIDSLPGQTDKSVPGAESAVPSKDQEVTADAASSTTAEAPALDVDFDEKVVVGAGVLAAKNFSDISGLRVGLIANQASLSGDRLVVDVLAEAPEIDLVALFAPEHGIRAKLGAGVDFDDDIDPETGLPVYSLFGSTRKPTPEMLSGIDVLVLDLQDVGSRFYTYISTMGLAMQAAAEQDIPFLVLDRPNPLGGELVDGALRADDQSSFVGQYSIPALHGMTVAELALAIKGEGWLPGLEALDLQVIKMFGWQRSYRWNDTDLLWTPPSPGLPTTETAFAYPSTVLFEATTLSYGRGTDKPFTQIGAPWLDEVALSERLNGHGLEGVRFVATTFTPSEPDAGASQPRFVGQSLPGVEIQVTDPTAIRPMLVGLYLIHEVMLAATAADGSSTVIDRPDFFDLVAGDRDVRLQLEQGVAPEVIAQGWQADLERFDEIRSRYLIY